ncbi:MAG: hypothetical protein HQL37_16035 [Alphaproteobacteria bacterium]|nr:hypothetical protein [Alphaproteobacteria bacterium]
MNALKALVLTMTLLIIAGLGLVAYGVLTRASRHPAPAASDAKPGTPFGAIALKQPEGSRLQTIAAADGRLFLHVDAGGRGPRVLVVDPVNGSLLGTLVLGAEP